MKRIALVGPLAVLLVADITGAVVTLGPAPHGVAASTDILATADVVIEPVDRMVLVGWWVAPLVVLAAMWFARARLGPVSPTVARIAGIVIGAAAIAIAAVEVLLDVDDAGVWPGVTLAALGLGGVLTGAVFLLWRVRPRPAKAVSVVLTATLAILGFLALWQTPDSVTDPYSFRFTGDELAAPAAGQFPLSGFAPLYTALLGWPIATVLRVWPDSSLWIILIWILLLQLLTVVLAVFLAVRAAGWRMLAPAAMLIVLPLVATAPTGGNVTSYFAVLPLRLVLPFVTLTIASFALTVPRDLSRRRSALLLLSLGVSAGTAAVNNIDFGVPLLAAVALVVVVDRQESRLLRVGILAVGAMLPVVAYSAIGLIASRPVDWRLSFFFPSVFGAEGYFNVPMHPVGLHVAFASLFVTATVVGVVLLRSKASRRASAPRRQGLLLLSVGSWSLLCMAYFSGRSYTSTLSTLALQGGLVTALFLPLIRAAMRSVRTYRPEVRAWVRSSTGLGLLAMATALSSATLLRPLSSLDDYSDERASPRSLLVDQARTLLDATARGDERIVGAARDGTLRQWLDRPALTTLATGVPSGIVVNNSFYFSVSRAASRKQCDELNSDGATIVIMGRPTLDALVKEPSCLPWLRSEGAFAVGGGLGLVAVPVTREVVADAAARNG